MEYVSTIALDLPYAEAVRRVSDALTAQGFSVLTHVDVRAAVVAGTGEEMEDYVLLGACHPRLTRRALDTSREFGFLSLCNVVVRDDTKGGALVDTLDPAVMVAISDHPDLLPIVMEASTLLRGVLGALSSAVRDDA